MSGPYAQYARRYLAAGYSPLPLPPRRKSPPPEGWTGAAGRIASAADVEAWCEEHPGANIGLRLPPGVIGIDVDAWKGPAELAAWQRLEERLGRLPDAPRSSSRKDGISGIRLFRVPGDYIAADMGPAGEVIQAHHRYVVAYPSVHPSGATYRWQGAIDGDDLHVANLPELPPLWLEELRAGGERGQGASGWTDPDLDKLVAGGIPAGAQQDPVLRDVCWKLARAGTARHIARAVWWSVVSRTPAARPAEPWTERDFERHWNRATAKVPAAETDTFDDIAETVSENSRPLTSGNNTSDSSDRVVYELRDGAWLDARQFPPLKYTIPGLMPAGLGLIAGPPKAGKSLLILDWVLAVALGGRALGALPVGPARDVLYLALEDGDRRLQTRCRHLLADGEPIPQRLRYILAVPPGQVLAVLIGALEEYPETALIVVDTLGRVMPLPMQGETTYQRDYRVAVALKRIADDHPGLTIIVVHHTRKAFSEDFIDSISGTHGLAGAADTVIAVTRGRGKHEGVLRVTGRDVIESEYAVLFRGGAWTLDGDDLREARANVRRRAEEAALSGRSAEIIEYVRSKPGGATTKQVTEKFGKDAATYLKRHTDARRLVKPKRGLYVVSEPSEVSEGQVSDGAETDTPMFSASEVSETEGER